MHIEDFVSLHKVLKETICSGYEIHEITLNTDKHIQYLQVHSGPRFFLDVCQVILLRIVLENSLWLIYYSVFVFYAI